MKINNKILGFILAFIAIVFWSVHSVAIRYMINELGVSSLILVFFRFSLGSILLAFLVSFFITKKDIKILFGKKNNIFKSKNFWFVSISMLVTITLLHFALKFTTASIGMLLQTLSPTIVVLYTMYFFQEKLNKYISIRKIFFLALFSSIGSGLIINDRSFINNSNGNLKYIGDILVMVSTFTVSILTIYTVELRREYKKANGLLITALYLGVGAILTIPFFIFNYDTLFPLTELKISLILLIGFCSTGLAYMLWFTAAKYLNSIVLSVFANILGITTVLTEYFVYQESNPITINLIIGGILIVTSAIYINFLTNKKGK